MRASLPKTLKFSPRQAVDAGVASGFSMIFLMGRLAWRDLCRALYFGGSLRLLVLVLALAVATVTAVGFFTERVRLAFQSQSQAILGADLLLMSDRPFLDVVLSMAEKAGLAEAQTVVFPSVVRTDTALQLAEIKAVSATYPLYGSLRIRNTKNEESTQKGQPLPGMVWVESRLLGNLGLVIGDAILIGKKHFTVAGIVAEEPDRGFGFMSLSPRVLMNIADLPETGLQGFGARLRYRLLLAGGTEKLSAFHEAVTPHLKAGDRFEDATQVRPEIRTVIERAGRFLRLAALVSVILASVAVFQGSRRYWQTQSSTCALFRCFGLSGKSLLLYYSFVFFGLLAIALVFGVFFGFAAHFALLDVAGHLLGLALPAPDWQSKAGLLWIVRAASEALFVSFALLLAFVLPVLLNLLRVPAWRALRHDFSGTLISPNRKSFFWGLFWWGIWPFFWLSGLIAVFAGGGRFAALAVGGFALTALFFWFLSRSFVFFAKLLSQAISGLAFSGERWVGLQAGLKSFYRHPVASTVQVLGLALGLTALLLLSMTSNALLDAWQQRVPPDAPNRFLFNIQPSEAGRVQDVLQLAGVKAALEPMIRGRLTAINNKAVTAADYPDDPRAQRLVEREFNLSMRPDLPMGNALVAGSLFPANNGKNLASVEQGLAKTLGLHLGDNLRFEVAGVEKNMRIANFRQLDWDSLKVNFFVIASQGTLDDTTASYITSFYLPPERAFVMRDLLAEFPHLTLVDVSALLLQFKSVLGQIQSAVQFIFLFSLIMGALVLYSSLVTSFDARRHEIALMRALGASKRQLQQSLFTELLLAGGTAGALAVLAASSFGEMIAYEVLGSHTNFHPVTLLVTMTVGAGIAVLSGFPVMRKLIETPPWITLRET